MAIRWKRTAKETPTMYDTYLTLASLDDAPTLSFYDPDRNEWNNDFDEAPLCWAVYNSPPLTKEERQAQIAKSRAWEEREERIRKETNYCLPGLSRDINSIIQRYAKAHRGDYRMITSPTEAMRFALIQEQSFDVRPITSVNITQELWLRILAEDTDGQIYPIYSGSTPDEKRLFGYPVNIVLSEDHALFEHAHA